MSIRRILHYPEPQLREPTRDVVTIDDEIRLLIEDMAETMYAAPGVGLAAPQIGLPLRLFLIDIARDDEPSDLRVFINAEILDRQGEQQFEEGCLSFPGVFERFKRAARVHVKALDETGASFELEAEGLLSVAIQHECDHISGKLLIDHLGPMRKRLVNRAFRKG